MEQKRAPSYPCPGCGFVVFSKPPGSYDICPLCDWEDDNVQLRLPGYSGGANKESLYQHQNQALKALPLSVQAIQGFSRDEKWRPLRQDEQVADGPGFGTEEAPYYWEAE